MAIDLAAGLAGQDTLVGMENATGGLGDDRIIGSAAANYLDGWGGSDTIFAGGGDDTIIGGEGRRDGPTYLRGEGGDGDDIVRGGQGNDCVYGEDGADWLSGDRGDDTIYGGAGADLFHTFGEAGVDRIMDFNPDEGDRLQFDPGTTYVVIQNLHETILEMVGGGRLILENVSRPSIPAEWIVGG